MKLDTKHLRWGICAALLVASPLNAHSERESFFPAGRVAQPPEYRPLFDSQGRPSPQQPYLVVCKRPDGEGVRSGEDSISRIGRIRNAALRELNLRLYDGCRHEHLQAAVDAVRERGTTIYVLPGIYREEPSIRKREQFSGAAHPEDATFCQAVLARGSDKLTYEEQFRCPHIQNTVAIFGDPNFADDNCGPYDEEGVCDAPSTVRCDPRVSACPYYDLQIEGTGERMTDVILTGGFIDRPGSPLDGQFEYLNGIRADRADNIYLRNFTAQMFEFNAMYVLEADGYAFDRVLARWNDEYGFLSFAADHGLYADCESWGNADSGPYPGSAADVHATAAHADADVRRRPSVEMRNCRSHHNALGYSGTAGNSVWIHDSYFYKNQSGIVTDSFVPNHPGHPQDHMLVEHNWIYNNNKDYTRFVAVDGPCNTLPPRDRGLVPPDPIGFDDLPPEVQEALLDRMVICPTFPSSIGTGVMLAGVNYNVFRDNIVFDNWKRGFMLFHVPAIVREEEDPEKAFDTSHFNRFLNNRFARNSFEGHLQPNGVDFWHDDSGVGNCWEGNTSAAGPVTADTDLGLPPGPCPDGPMPTREEQLAAENPARIAFLTPCARYDRRDPSSKDGCEFLDPPEPPENREGRGAQAIATRPTRAVGEAGRSVRTGYVVLDNDTSRTHRLRGATVLASGPVDGLRELRLSVNGQEAVLNRVDDTNEFRFDEPVEVLPAAMTLIELQATPNGEVAQAQALMLASGATGSMLIVLMAAAPGQRRRWWIAAMLLATVAVASCDSSSGVVKGDLQFVLGALDITDGSNGAVHYRGVPLRMGELHLP